MVAQAQERISLHKSNTLTDLIVSQRKNNNVLDVNYFNRAHLYQRMIVFEIYTQQNISVVSCINHVLYLYKY